MSDAWVGVVGAIAGVVVGSFATYWVNRSNREHEDRRRFAEDKRDVYGTFHAKAEKFENDSSDYLDLANDVQHGKKPAADIRALARPSLDDVWKAKVPIALLGSTKVIAAADLVERESFSFWALLDLAGLDPGIWAADSFADVDFAGLTEARNAFLSAAREDLGIQ